MSTQNGQNGQRSHIVSLYVSNKPGVLNRITLIFSRRGWNIDSLAVSEGHDGAFSHCTIVAKGESDLLFKVITQLNKLVDVIHAEEHLPDEVLNRELALAKVGCNGARPRDIVEALRGFRGEMIDASDETVTIELRGTSLEINAAHQLLSERFKVLELIRTGTIAIAKGRGQT